jgi:NADPH:quinone reductase-like Zn-dependent oxidoreductase
MPPRAASGSFAAQLAKWKGAYVFPERLPPATRDLLRSLGVDQPIDYTTTKFEDVAKDIDVALDTVGGDYEERSARTLKPGGTLVSILSPTSIATAQAYGGQGKYFGAQSNPAHLAEVASLIDAGKLKPLIDRVYSLQEVAKAHEYVAAGHARGKVVLQIVP